MAASAQPPAASTQPDYFELGRSSQSFAARMYRAVAQDQPSNFAVSPISIELGLVLSWAGAQGETARQMAEVLELGGSATEVHSAFAGQLREWR
jgi:serpin B